MKICSEVQVKICGISTDADLDAAAEAGAAYVGFVFFPKSPRNIPPENAQNLAERASGRLKRVALTVDASDSALDRIVEVVPVDMIQLHGAETPSRVAEVRKRCDLPVMKAISVRNEEDLEKIARYSDVSDQLLVDAKPNESDTRPGGLGVPFDWRLIADFDWPIPWMLAGGLNSGNVAEAMRLTKAERVDVSTGVEVAPGRKSAEKIRQFIAAARK